MTPYSLSEYVALLRRRYILIASLTLVTAAVAFFLSSREPKQYAASAELLLGATEPASGVLELYETGSIASERDLNTDLALVEVAPVVRGVEAQLRIPAEELREKVSARVKNNSRLISITANGESPQTASAIANAFAEGYVAFRRDAARARLEKAAALLRNRLEALSPEERSAPTGTDLASRLRQLELAAAVQTGGAEVVQPAIPPTRHSAPRPAQAGIVGGLLGLVLGVATALLLELGQRRLKDEDDVQEKLDLSILAAVPRPRHALVGSTDWNQRLHDRAYSDLAERLEIYMQKAEPRRVGALSELHRFPAVLTKEAQLSEPFRVLMLCSPAASDDKTHVTLGLARALALTGKRVIAVEADVQRPRFASYLQMPGDSDLTARLGESFGLNQKIDAATMAPVSEFGSPTGRCFSVLRAGVISSQNGGTGSSGSAMRSLLLEARRLADIVLIDAPPIRSDYEAVPFVDLVDVAVPFVRLDRTGEGSAQRTVRVLRNLDVPLAGVVVEHA